jgi:hypothetical protein
MQMIHNTINHCKNIIVFSFENLIRQED